MDARHFSIAAMAARQHGVVSAAEAAMCGFSDAEVERLCRGAEWTRLRRGLYYPCSEPEAMERVRLDCAAALRAVDIKDAAVAHVSAARLWEAKWLLDPPGSDVWIACDVPGKPRYYPGLRILPSQLPEEDVTKVGGLPVSTPARTAVDLARHLAFDPALVVVESLRHRYGIGAAELSAVLERCRGWPHIQRARRVITFSGSLSESPLESRARLAFRRADVPSYRQQVEVVDAYGEIRRLDFLFGRRSGVETDGRVKYQTPEDLWKEKRRADGLHEVGVRLLRLGAADLHLEPRVLRRRIVDHMIRAGDWIEGVGPVAA